VIRRRLIFLFVLQISIVLFIAGIYLRYHLQNVLEDELGAKLETVAATIAVQMDASLISLLTPGDEETRIYRVLKERLLEIKSASHMQRISIFSSEGRIWLDTEPAVKVGESYLRMDFDGTEIRRALQGRTNSSILFEGRDGRLYKSAYAPLKAAGQVKGIVAVQGSAHSLKAIKDVQKTLFQIGLVALSLSILLAVFSSHRITSPLLRLQQAARRIGKGDLSHRIELKGKDEIAFLAQTMEEMRDAIVRRDQQQTAMLAGVAHEIRNPLGGIELFAGLLLDELQIQESREKVERILKETRNLKQLIQNFLDYAKPIEPRPEECRVSAVWKEVEGLLSNQLDKKNVKVTVDGDAVLFVDCQHLKQIFLNLGINAMQAMSESKENRIAIRIESTQERTNITFRDTGAGISDEVREHIFEPFFSSKAKGLGLGLALVKNLIQKNRGDIRLLDTGPQGTTFELLFYPDQEEGNRA